MAYIKTIFIIGILVLIFPVFGFPEMFENALLIIFGIILILSALFLRKQVPHKKKIDPESTSFSENDLKEDEEIIENPEQENGAEEIVASIKEE